MRRRLFLVAAAIALSFFASTSATAASLPIPGTPVTVVELGSTSQVVAYGTSANFSWGVYNGGPATYTLDISASGSEPSFTLEIPVTSATLPPEVLVQLYLNVSTSGSGSPRTAPIHVWFNTTDPVVSSLERIVTVSARAAPAPISVLAAFLAIGAVIAIGFTASLIFERTRVPDLLILIVLGLLLGPVTLAYLGISFVPPGVLEVATPYFTALAIMMILFDGGLNLRLSQVVKHLGLIGLHTGVAFVLTVFAIAYVTTTVLGYPWLVGLLLGAILGGTSSDVVIAIVRGLKVSDETKVILTLEAVLTDILCVVTVFALIELLRGGPGASGGIVFVSLGQAFLVSIAFGVAFGMGWLVLLGRLEKKPFAYMLTIAVLFVLYAVSQSAGGSGAMSAFVFGLLLGNHQDFERRLRRRMSFVVDDRIRQFHGELSFVIRTFFFVFLGIVFTLQFSGGWAVATTLPGFSSLNGTFTLFFVGVLLVFGTIAVVRVIAARITVAIHPKPPAERRVLWSLMGRGLSAAVLASLPFTIPAFTSPGSAGDVYYSGVLAPYNAQFLNLAFFIILLTVGATTLGVVASEHQLGRAPRRTVAPDPRVLAFLQGTDPDEISVSEEPPPQEDAYP